MNEPRLSIELLGGDSRSSELPATGTLVLGSSRERAGLLVEGAGVDEAHCAIGRTKEGDWAIKDLGSKSGTLVNGQRVSSTRLKLGDQIVLGARRLEIVSAQADAARLATQSIGSARPSDVPQKIGGYRIERLIGKGGMGAVYLAVQESLRRPVALKVLAPKLAADLDFVHRFQAEARAAAALSHPNVVVVYDVGEENGAHYLSMEFMAGGSLEQKLAASGPLSWRSVLGVLADAAAGLAYAESRGIVHRDIKPANLMYSGTGTVKIADLGLATTLEAEANEAEGGRKVYGTPHFIAPEQARGEAVDHRSDLYALGATAYRLLSGHTPFEGASTREILRALQSEEPRALKELVPDLSPELEGLVTRLMQKQPAQRFPTAEALRRECERLRLLTEHGSTLVARSSASHAQRWISLALLVVVLGALGTWYALGGARALQAPPSAGPDSRAASGTADANGADPFFGDASKSGAAPGEPDEERALRAREHEAERALHDIGPLLATNERIAALQRIQNQYPGTAAAANAERELTALASGAATHGPTPEALAAALEELRARLAALRAGETPAPLAELLRELDAYRPAPELAEGFEPQRNALAGELVEAAAAAVRGGFEEATRLALNGDFDAVRQTLAALDARLAGLDEGANPARFEALKPVREELAERHARVDDEERFYRSNQEHAARLALGAALGPGSGLLAEISAMDLDALDKRLVSLPPELRARPLATTLAREIALARGALEALRREFASGGWRRKQLVDPRTKKVREVRDVLVGGLVFDKDGTLETIAWREAKGDPDWWHQLFQARLARDWSAAEVRGILALLRLIGAAHGAELAREMIDARGRGLLQPTELDALEKSFAPTAQWLENASGVALEPRAELAHESAAARGLARALGAAQNHSWTSATVYLERLLAEQGDTLLVGLLSDGSEWREAAPPHAPAPPSAPGDAAKKSADPQGGGGK